ncbi:M81 family metallopeptidase [Aliamphritea hakodatensis]|uniref:M81 family metallopeptidase n=1 Tax=Aliamphritea hakodatensis TaxID=2895352 RepID=UPI0022FD4FBF|nr:M81 family metallopeptidase [Aliamphritea hakodatensis]
MRIAVASFQHETNTFSPRPTEYADYLQEDSWPGLLLGEDVCRVLAGLNIASEGFIQAARQQGHSIVPVNWCSAEPGGKVTDETFERIMQLVLDGIRQAGEIDALFLDLHGAMVSESYDDGEGEVVRRIRAAFGEQLPIVASLDFHANLSEAFVSQIDAMAVYRTYPHLDMADTGARCMALLEQQQAQQPLYKAFIQIPYLIPLSSQHTGSAPNVALFEALSELEATPGISNIEFAMGFPAADIPDSGASIAVFGNDRQQVEAVCRQFYDRVLAAEGQYTDNLMSTAQALDLSRSLQSNAPVVLADVQDNSGAGASSDTTGMLADLMAGGAQKTIVAVLADGAAAAAAHRAGAGAVIDLALGGQSGVAGLGPCEGRFEVMAVADGNFTCVGDMYAGCEVKIGPMALLKVVADTCDIQIIVSTERYACTDLAVYTHVGINPLEYALLVVKSTVHFRAAFEPISDHILSVAAPGLHPCQLGKLKYQKLRSHVRLGPCGPVHMSATDPA